MKKIVLLAILLLSLPNVLAEEINITKDSEVRYKWYQNEIEEGIYYPKKDILPDYLEDKTKVEYGEYSDWNEDNCSYDNENYLIERKNITTYQKIANIKYVLVSRASATCYVGNCLDGIDIYYDHKKVDYKLLTGDAFSTLIELPESYEPEKLIFLLETEHQQIIYLDHKNVRYHYAAASQATKEKIVFFSDDWKTSNDTEYLEVESINEIPNIPLIKNVTSKEVCRVREIKTYRYKVHKKYYDDNYYLHLDNYLPDINDYTVNYLKEFPVTQVEIIKEVPITKVEKEYVYQEVSPSIEPIINEKTIYKTEYKDKIVTKIPSKIYLVIGILSLIIIFQFIKIIAKKED